MGCLFNTLSPAGLPQYYTCIGFRLNVERARMCALGAHTQEEKNALADAPHASYDQSLSPLPPATDADDRPPVEPFNTNFSAHSSTRSGSGGGGTHESLHIMQPIMAIYTNSIIGRAVGGAAGFNGYER